MKILLGDITSYKAISVSKFLKKNYKGIKIYTFDSRKFTQNLRTKYSDKHLIIEPDDISSYIDIIKKYNVDYFFPVINNTIDIILENREKIGGCLDYIGEYKTFKILNDKKQLVSLASKLGIKIPKTYSNIAYATLKCIIKPINLSSARGVIYINNYPQLQKAKEKYINNENVIIQEYVEGIGVGYSVYVRDGKILTGYGHKRLAEYPVSGGSSVYRETYNDKRMQDIAEKILEKVKWTGFAMFEFKLAANNELYLIEVNPRIWGSINQGLQNGINYFESFLGKVPLKGKINIKTYLSPLIYLSILKYLINFNIKPLIIFLRNVKKNRPDVSLIDDPKGWLSTILRKIL